MLQSERLEILVLGSGVGGKLIASYGATGLKGSVHAGHGLKGSAHDVVIL